MERFLKPESSTSPGSIAIRIVDSYAPEDREYLASGQKDPTQTGSHQLQWRRPEKHVFVYERGKMACHVGLLRHVADVAGHPVPVGGIGGVLTRQEFQGRGYARFALAAAEEFALRQWNVDFLLLFCRPALQGWYQSSGWQKVPDSVWVEQEQGTILMPLVTMVKPLAHESWTQGEVRLRSQPW